MLLEKIGKVERTGETRRTSSDNQNVRFQNFMFDAHRAILAEAQGVSSGVILRLLFPCNFGTFGSIKNHGFGNRQLAGARDALDLSIFRIVKNYL